MGNLSSSFSFIKCSCDISVCVCVSVWDRNNVSKSRKLFDSHMGHMSVGRHLLIYICVFVCVYPKSQKITSFLGFLLPCVCVCMFVCVCVCIWARGWYRPQPKRKEQLVCQLKDVIKHEMGCQHHVGRGSERGGRRVCVCIYLGMHCVCVRGGLSLSSMEIN